MVIYRTTMSNFRICLYRKSTSSSNVSTSAVEAMFDKLKEDILNAVGRYVDSAKMEVLQGKKSAIQYRIPMKLLYNNDFFISLQLLVLRSNESNCN